MKTITHSLLLAACLTLAGTAAADGHLAKEGKHKAHTSVSISGLALNVDSIPRSEKYYSEIFSMRRVFQYPPEGTPIEIGLGIAGKPGPMLILAHFNDDPLPDGRRRYGRIVFNTDDAWALAKKAETRGAKIRQVGAKDGPIILFFEDPDGYEVELYQAR